jgi:hypothetical protein
MRLLAEHQDLRRSLEIQATQYRRSHRERNAKRRDANPFDTKQNVMFASVPCSIRGANGDNGRGEQHDLAGKEPDRTQALEQQLMNYLKEVHARFPSAKSRLRR